MKKLTTLFLFASMILAPICMQGQDLQFRYELDNNFDDSSTFMRTATNNFAAPSTGVTFLADTSRGGTHVADFDGTAHLTSTGYIGPQGNLARSATMWIKTSSTDPRGLMDWGLDGVAGERWSFILTNGGTNGGDLLVVTKGGVARAAGIGVSDGTWHHIAFTFDTAGVPEGNIRGIKFYLDGVFLSGATFNVPPPINTVDGGDVKIGSDFLNRKFVGQMSDVRLYSKQLTAVEVAAIHAGTLSSKGVDINQLASIYPNPVKDRLYIKTKLNDADVLNIKIYNTLGKLVNSPVYNKGNGNIEVNMENLTSGLYFGIAESKNAISSFKILKQ